MGKDRHKHAEFLGDQLLKDPSVPTAADLAEKAPLDSPTFTTVIGLTPGSLSSLGTPADGTLGFANDLSDVTPGVEASDGGSAVGLVARCDGRWIVACGQI